MPLPVSARPCAPTSPTPAAVSSTPVRCITTLSASPDGIGETLSALVALSCSTPSVHVSTLCSPRKGPELSPNRPHELSSWLEEPTFLPASVPEHIQRDESECMYPFAALIVIGVEKLTWALKLHCAFVSALASAAPNSASAPAIRHTLPKRGIPASSPDPAVVAPVP